MLAPDTGFAGNENGKAYPDKLPVAVLVAVLDGVLLLVGDPVEVRVEVLVKVSAGIAGDPVKVEVAVMVEVAVAPGITVQVTPLALPHCMKEPPSGLTVPLTEGPEEMKVPEDAPGANT